MTGGTDYLIKTCNSIAQLSNFLLLFVTLDGCSSHNDITGFQDNEVPSIINSFSVISTTILSMTGGMDYLIRTSNYIAQLSNFLLFLSLWMAVLAITMSLGFKTTMFQVLLIR